MTTEERRQARANINGRPLTDFVSLQTCRNGNRSFDGNMYACPAPGCNSGHSSSGDTAFMIYPDYRCICRSCNQFGGDRGEDTLGALRVIWEATENEVFDRVGAAQLPAAPARQEEPKTEKPLEDFTEYFEQMAANLEGAAEYLSSRHISLDTARRFMLGYDVRFSKGTGGRYWRALIIPHDKYHYQARNTDKDAGKDYRHRKVPEGGKFPLFNQKALHNAEKRPVFIVEAPIDAISITEAGGFACALGGTGSTRLMEHLKNSPTESTLLLALDKDEPGRKGTEDLEKKLTEAGKKAGIDFEAVTIYDGSAKDANEALCRDPDGFRAAIRAAEAKHRPGAGMVQSFFQAISSRKYEPMPTGLEPLDDVIGGGFIRQTLVMMGAAPGMGKSFFAQQLFEGMAQQGHNVLYFNLEMSREQMLARSFARIARQREGATMTAIDVLQGYRWTDAQRATVERTAAAYTAEIAPHMAYNPGGSTAQLDVILDQMNSAAQRAIDAGKEAPLVVIDYLHLLRGDQREDAQTIIKRAIEAFKDYAMKYNTVVFVILAFGRDNNKKGKVNQESGRDSSAIEYGADLMMGLNFAKLEDNQDEELVEKIREATQKEGRENGQTDYRLKITKNRLQGGTGSIDLVFSGRYGLFFPRLDKRSGMQRTDEDLPFENNDAVSYKEWRKNHKK